MNECTECKADYKIFFKRKYEPKEFLVGKRNSKIWIVGLNPKGSENNMNDNMNINELIDYFNTEKVHSYFKDFKKVSSKLYELLGEDKGVAHTDIVKCYSKKFDFKTKDKKAIIANCKQYFEKQLNKHKPEIIICNGSPVCEEIKKIIKPPEDYDTSYKGSFNGKEIVVILSGFIGRIDDYAKRRLGIEIDEYIKKI